MTDDQAKRISDLQDRLLDTVIREADPENWSGGEEMTRDLTAQNRGDRYWCLKIAVQAVTLYARMGDLVTTRKAVAAGESSGDVDDEIKQAEKQASKLLTRIQDGIAKRDAKA